MDGGFGEVGEARLWPPPAGVEGDRFTRAGLLAAGFLGIIF
jgi:hypothetical protein